MARIRSFQPGGQDVKRHPSEVDCYVQTVSTDDGDLLHLSTFGSDERQSNAKSSQSLQLNRALALELRAILDDYIRGRYESVRSR